MYMAEFVFEMGKFYDIRVKPNSSRSKVCFDDGRIVVFVRAVPDKNKANDEVIKVFKKSLRVRVEIVKGERSRLKRVRVL